MSVFGLESNLTLHLPSISPPVEFELPEVLRLWDSLFSDEERFSFLNYVCVAMQV